MRKVKNAPFRCRDTVWKVYYVLTTESGQVVDAETVADLTESELSEALSNARVQSQYTGDISHLFPYAARFSLVLDVPVLSQDVSAFKDALQVVWQQLRPGVWNLGGVFFLSNFSWCVCQFSFRDLCFPDLASIDISILRLEELVRSDG